LLTDGRAENLQDDLAVGSHPRPGPEVKGRSSRTRGVLIPSRARS